ncbi:ionotropic receptor 75a-like [Anopheles nili]|uniref:ionotropic receptor 75a-like n=1 Tax=Anopheles nili TaxID=185578 RepID=UPI00237C295A|nr:ionotropic receptor 75a-like [Anopheles nili]
MHLLQAVPRCLWVVILLAAVVVLANGSTVKSDDYSETVATFVFRFIRDHKGLKLGVVFGCDQKLLLIYKVLSQLATGGVLTRSVHIDRVGEPRHERYSSTLRQSLEFHQFVLLDMACENAPDVLEQASRYELFNASFHWLIIDKNYNRIVDSDETATDGSLAWPATTKGNTSSENTFHRLAEPVDYGPGADGSIDGGWTDDCNGTLATTTFDLLATMNVSINAELTVARPTDASYRGFTLYDLWNPGFISGGKLKVELLGRYSPADGLVIGRRETTVVRRRNMDGLKLKIMTVVIQKPHQPFERYLTTPQNTHLDSVHRYNYGLMSMLRDFYNFTFVNRRTKSWGYLRNGKFDGMIGALSRREVDLGGSPMYFRQERHRVVSYTTRSFIERPCFIFRHPPRNEAVKNPFLLPFEIIVWYLMVACGSILTLALCCSFFVEDAAAAGGAVDATANNCHNKDTRANISTTHRSHPADGNAGAKCNYKAEKVSKSILLFVGGVCQQGLSEIPHLSSGRCTSFFILLFGYLMYQYYSASIVGTLLMEQPKTIKTLRGLIDSRLTLGIEDIPYSRDYFVRTTDADSLELHRTRIEYYEPRTGRNESHFLPAADGLQLVREGGYAFHVAISAAYRIIRRTFGEREICELSEIDMFPVWSQWMVAIVQKNSPYRDVITYGLRRLNEAGLMQRQRHVWQEPKPKCVRQIAPTDLIVGLDAVVSAFVLLLTGAALAIGVLVLEILCHRLRLARYGL